MGALISTLLSIPPLMWVLTFFILFIMHCLLNEDMNSTGQRAYQRLKSSTPVKQSHTNLKEPETQNLQESLTFLKTQTDLCRQDLVTAERSLANIGPANTLINAQNQHESALELMNDLQMNFGKFTVLFMHYEKNISKHDTRYHYKVILMELDIKLQTLMLTCSRLITELHEIIRKERDILVKFSSIVVKLEEVDTIVGNNSATPSQSDPDDVILSKLVALRGDINACEKMIQQFLADYRFAFELPLATLKKRIDASWDRRSSKIKDLQIQNLESAAQCGICLENQKEIALTCGHQLCTSCYDAIRGVGNGMQCPFCRQPLQLAVRLY